MLRQHTFVLLALLLLFADCSSKKSTQTGTGTRVITDIPDPNLPNLPEIPLPSVSPPGTDCTINPPNTTTETAGGNCLGAVIPPLVGVNLPPPDNTNPGDPSPTSTPGDPNPSQTPNPSGGVTPVVNQDVRNNPDNRGTAGGSIEAPTLTVTDQTPADPDDNDDNFGDLDSVKAGTKRVLKMGIIPSNFLLQKAVPLFVINASSQNLTYMKIQFSRATNNCSVNQTTPCAAQPSTWPGTSSTWLDTDPNGEIFFLNPGADNRCQANGGTLAPGAVCQILLSVRPRVITGTSNPSNPNDNFNLTRDYFYKVTVDKNGNNGGEIEMYGRIVFNTYIHYLVMGANRGAPRVILRNLWEAGNESQSASFYAYPETLGTGVRVASCDMDNDGQPDIITVPGFNRDVPANTANYSTIAKADLEVKVFDGKSRASTPTVLRSYNLSNLPQYQSGGTRFQGGGFVACGDVMGDGSNEVIVGMGYAGPIPSTAPTTAQPNPSTVDSYPASASGSYFSVLSNTLGHLTSGFAFEPTFKGGVVPAAGKVIPGSTKQQMLFGAGDNGGPRVRAVDYASGNGIERASFFAINDDNFRGGVFAAAFRPNLLDDPSARVVAGAGRGGGPRIDVMRLGPDGGEYKDERVSFFAFNDFDTNRDGVQVEASMGLIIASRFYKGAEVVVYEPVSDTQHRWTFNRSTNPAQNIPVANDFGTNYDGGIFVYVSQPPAGFALNNSL